MRMAPSGPHPSLISRKQDHDHLPVPVLCASSKLRCAVPTSKRKIGSCVWIRMVSPQVPMLEDIVFCLELHICRV